MLRPHRLFYALAFMAAVLSACAYADEWVDYATVSMTNPTAPKLTANRLCYTDGRDIACDGAAGLFNSSGTLSITNISATALTVNGVGVTGGGGDNLGNHIATQALNLNSNNLTGSGNITFSGANPSITSGGSYITIPYGAYFSGGTTYFQTNTNFRAGISNDTATNLVINGGTSGVTSFPGTVDIGWERVTGSTATSSVATCTAGKQVLGGGCLMSAYNGSYGTGGFRCSYNLYGIDYYTPASSYPSSATQWTCGCPSGVPAAGTITAYAICARFQ